MCPGRVPHRAAGHHELHVKIPSAKPARPTTGQRTLEDRRFEERPVPPPELSGLRRLVHRAFEAGVGLKGLDGALEIIGGLLLLTISPRHVSTLVLHLPQHELSEDPHDLVARYLVTLTKGLTAGGQPFGAMYLLTHGIIKLALMAALLKRRLWAYPAAIGIFALFGAYQGVGLAAFASCAGRTLIFLAVACTGGPSTTRKDGSR